jgi:RHS repeat-associated protein
LAVNSDTPFRRAKPAVTKKQKQNSESMKHNTRHWAGITAGILSLAGYASAATLGSEKYTYDASGNIIEKSIDGVVTKMSYDKANRLIGRQVDGQAKQTTAYDAAGRPVTEQNTEDQTTRSMRYGYDDKVLETQSRDSKVGFYYNAEGQLVGKNVKGNVSTYTWDGNVLAAEGSEVFANEAHISGGVPVLSSKKNVVIADYLGNTLVLGSTNFSSTAYGEGLEDGRFTGKSYVAELGCYVFSHRLYSAKTNRWISADPYGFPDGPNNSAYVNNDPITRIDPSGLNFLIFDRSESMVYEYDGSGYNTTTHVVTVGDKVRQWAARSNNTSQDDSGGMTPLGWYAVGAQQTPLGQAQDNTSEDDWESSGPDQLHQGQMVMWGNAAGDGDLANVDVGSGESRTDRIISGHTKPSNRSDWKWNFGNNWKSNRRKTSNNSTDVYTFPSNREPKSAIKIHPEGGVWGTHGCIGIIEYVKCETFKAFLGNNPDMEIFVEN